MTCEFDFIVDHENAEIHAAVMETLKIISVKNPDLFKFAQADDVIRITLSLTDVVGYPNGDLPMLIRVNRRHIVADPVQPHLLLYLEWC